MRKYTLEEVIEQYIDQIGAVQGELTLEDIRRAFETGFQAGQLLMVLEELDDVAEDEIN